MFLLDSDVVKKICQYHLLHELAAALGCGLNAFAVLPQLKFQLRLADVAKAVQKLGSQEAVDQARELVAAAAEVQVVAEAANPILGLNRPDIDSGEATLFAALHDVDADSLISGDKRAFIALSEINGVAVVDVLWARLICLEEAMHLIVQSANFDHVSAKVRANLAVDTAIGIAFGRATANSPAMVIEALASYMSDLHARTSGKYVLP
ncbi:hypothetical protein HNO86_03675 [Pseudomonas sp. C1C7]|uniref:hypothetical protein n=1 Tax=Pseudomonas sp. C1C7 TaxID=2735272 RepID=UPI0015863274|nr:hypothetical protein [Pseudomonas sp. C1C7]NUT74139.1 hypothetical protein [Pseudomonas sp. C1C7]